MKGNFKLTEYLENSWQKWNRQHLSAPNNLVLLGGEWQNKDGFLDPPKILNFLINDLRKSERVNVRGIPTDAYQVLHLLPEVE